MYYDTTEINLKETNQRTKFCDQSGRNIQRWLRLYNPGRYCCLQQEPSPLLAKASAEEPYVEMEIIPDTVSEPPADTTSVSIEEPQTPQPEKSVKKV